MEKLPDIVDTRLSSNWVMLATPTPNEFPLSSDVLQFAASCSLAGLTVESNPSWRKFCEAPRTSNDALVRNPCRSAPSSQKPPLPTRSSWLAANAALPRRRAGKAVTTDSPIVRNWRVSSAWPSSVRLLLMPRLQVPLTKPPA